MPTASRTSTTTRNARSTRGNRTKPASRTARGRKPGARTTTKRSAGGRTGTRSSGRGRSTVQGGRTTTRAQRSTRSRATSRSSRNKVRGEGIVANLVQDHRNVESLLNRLTETDDSSERQRLFETCYAEIMAHAKLEEAIFYPAFKQAVGRDQEDRLLYFEAAEEHHAVERLLEEMQDGDYGTEKFQAQCILLKELIEHHVKEEESEMFPIARREMGKERLVELAQDFQERKPELLQTYAQDGSRDEGRKSGGGPRSGSGANRQWNRDIEAGTA